MLPALRSIVDWIVCPIAITSSLVFGATNAQGMRFPLELGGASNLSAQTGSKCRSYQATYCSTMGCVAG